MRLRVLIVLLVGCASEAEIYQRAISEPGFDSAVEQCERLEPALAGDCLVSVFGLHHRLERTDCDRVVERIWREECVFQFAERAAAAGELPVAFDACATSAFGRECSFHLLREAARPTLDQTPAEAAPALAPYLALEPTPDAPRLFWRTWFRDRLVKERPIDPTGCPDEACRGGAKEALFGSLHAIARADGPAFCTQPVSRPSLWTPGPLTDAWVAEWQAAECTRRRLEGTGTSAGASPLPRDTPPAP